jgi:hypothetical protein
LVSSLTSPLIALPEGWLRVTVPWSVIVLPERS